MDDGSRPLRLLSLDGGGIRGLSTLLVLRSIMHQIEDIESADVPRPLKPANYFDLIGGTSTGGLIAIMLGRLGMDIEQCIKTYLDLSPNIFPTESLLGGSKLGKLFKGAKGTARFPSAPFESELRDLMLKHGLDKEAKLEAEDNNLDGHTKVFVCCTSQGVNKEVRLRTYRSWEPGTDCSIWQAARATSAAPLFFNPITFGTPPRSYVDGGLHMNNPIRAVVDEARSLRTPDQERKIGCIVSIGTGIQSLQGVGTRGHQIIAALANAATDCEKVAREYREELQVADPCPEYFRFSVDGLHGIGLEEWEQFDKLSGATADYLRTHRDDVQRCALAISGPSTFNSTKHRRHTQSYGLRVNDLPSSTDTFFGRSTELLAMHSQLAPSESGRKGFVLHGIPGAGKTQLALRYVADYGTVFNYILWISAASDTEVELSFSEAAHTLATTELRLPKPSGDNSRTDREYVHTCLENWVEPNWLIVLDSLDSLSIGSWNYLPKCNHGSVLITSIRADTKARYKFPGLEVSRLDEKSACALLSSLSDLPDNEEGGGEDTPEQSILSQIARQLDYHALALQLSGVLLRKRWVKPDNFISSLQLKYAKLMDESPKPWEWSYDKNRSVWQAFHILFSELKKANPTSAALFCLCAHYGSWTLSRDFLVFVATYSGSEDQLLLKDLESGVCLPQDEIDLLKAIDDLEDLSLVNTIRDKSRSLQQVIIRGPLLKWCMESLGQRLDWGLLACSYISASIQQAFRAAFNSVFKAASKDEFHWHEAGVYHHNMRCNIAAQRCYHQVRKLSAGGLDDTLRGLTTPHRVIFVAFLRQYGELIYSIGHTSQDYRLGMELIATVVDNDRQSQGADWPRDLDSFLTWSCKALTCLRLNEDAQEAEESLASIYETGQKKFASEERFLSKIQTKLAGMKMRPKANQPYQAKARLAAFQRSSIDDLPGPVVVRSLRSYQAEYDTARPASPYLELSHLRHSQSLSRDCATDMELKRNKGPLALPYFPQNHPPKIKDFFARRDALDLMTAKLWGTNANSSADCLNAFEIFGPSGVGKTQLALEYIFSSRHHYDAIFWVAADNHDRLLRDFGAIAIDLQIVFPVGDQSVDCTLDLCALTKSWLENPYWTARDSPDPRDDTPVKWLLVFDNVVNPLDLENLWPIDGRGSILKTGRKSALDNGWHPAHVRGMQRFELLPFGLEDSVTFMCFMLGTIVDEADEALIALAKRADGFPPLLGLPSLLILLAHVLALSTSSPAQKLAKFIDLTLMVSSARSRLQLSHFEDFFVKEFELKQEDTYELLTRKTQLYAIMFK